MKEIMELIEKKYNSDKTEECIDGLKMSADIIKKLSDMSLNLLKNDKLDLLFITEYLSTFFDKFMESLYQFLDSDDENIRFWASALQVHYSLRNVEKATAILLDTIKYGNLEQAELATVILKKANSPFLHQAISVRLEKRNLMDRKTIRFFEEKLE